LKFALDNWYFVNSRWPYCQQLMFSQKGAI
jgi:hypothetical protein